MKDPHFSSWILNYLADQGLVYNFGFKIEPVEFFLQLSRKNISCTPCTAQNAWIQNISIESNLRRHKKNNKITEQNSL